MRAGAAWGTGLTLSAVLHGAAAVILVPAYAPQDTPRQQPPETRLELERVAAPRQEVAAQDPDGDTASEGQTQGTRVGAGAVPQSDARQVTAQAAPQTALAVPAPPATSANPSAADIDDSAPDPARISPTSPGADTLAAQTPDAAQTAQTPPPPAQSAQSARADATQVDPTAPRPAQAPLATSAVDTVATIAAAGQTLGADTPDAPQVSAVAPPQHTQSVRSARAEATQIDPTAPRPAPAAPATSAVDTLATIAAGGQIVGADTPDAPQASAVAAPAAQALPAQRPAPDRIPTVATAPRTAPPAAPPAASLAATPPGGNALSQSSPQAIDADETMPPATSARAALAWQFGDRVVTDSQALSTIQAFMEPAALDDADGVKDDLSSVLTGVDCARLSATFIPETGTLEMRGHIPDPALQDQVVAALQEQVGEGIPVTANLRHLPEPQCGALSGIAAAGLPQSTDQFTDARLVGQTAHAREYSYVEGQRLQFDLTAPDYDAYVYVDYFNADGEVIHLVPNDTVALERRDAASVFGVGKDRAGRPGLRITIGPPFGQEIAVAFAASHRLYEGVRPIVEPAGPYLQALQDMVAKARATHEDFKGEWVYFFITTTPATQ